MGRLVLGQQPGGVLSVDRSGKTVEWNASGVEGARVYVTCTGPGGAGTRQLFTEALAGRTDAPWLDAAMPCKFELVAFEGGQDGPVLAGVTVTAQGTAAIPAAVAAPIPVPAIVPSGAAAGLTGILSSIPRTYLIGGGILVAVLLLKRRR